MPPKVPYTPVVVDAEGKIAINVEQYTFYPSKSTPNAKYTKMMEAIDESCKLAKGLLGDTSVPAEAENAKHFYNLQQFDQLELELNKLTSAPAKAFKDTLKAKTTEYTARRLNELQGLAPGNPLGAYRETASFVKAFPKAKEASAANSLLQKLASNPKVRKENEAESAYNQMILPEVTKAGTGAQYDKKVKPLMDAFLARYADTEFGASAKLAQESVRKSLRF